MASFLSDTKLYVTMWEDWLSAFNALNGNTLKKLMQMV